MSYIGTRDEYKKRLEKNEIGNDLDNCPFCNILKKSEEIIWEWNHWYIVYNIFPYTGNSQHIMAIPKSHIWYASEINSETWSEFGEVQRMVARFFEKNEYFSCTRETLSGRSMEHYHIHFLPGTLKWKFLRKMLEMQGFPIKQELILN